MTAVEIHNTTEAKQRLHDALNILDAISAYSINHQLPSEQLFDIDVRKRLQSLYPKLPSPIYPLLEKSDELSEDEKQTLSPYCYKIKDSAGDFDDVLGGLEAHYKQMNAQNLASKGELIDTIIRGGVSKTIRSVAVILDVIGSLALWHIREVEARTVATRRGHQLVSQEDKSNAATEMWQYLSAYNGNADRTKLDARITAGIRWDRFLGEREIGMIVTVHKLPPSLKFQTKLIVKLALIVADMTGTLDQAKKATPCMQKLLDSRLGPWAKKRKLPVQSLPEPDPKRRRTGTEAESGIPGSSSNSIGALLNAAEHIAVATQGQQLPSVRSSSTPDRMNSSPESLVPEEIHPLAGEEVHVTTGGQPEWTNKEGSTGLESGAKVKGTSQLASGMEIAIMAEVVKLECTLGGYLFKGMNLTRMRHREKDAGMVSFTDTVRLHFAYNAGGDFKLEVWLCSSIGKAISQALTSVEDLRSLLGDYLFEGMSECAGAVNVSFPNVDEGSDCKAEVMLNFGTGKDVYENIYRRVG